jgi:hypothetical protein
MAMPTRDILDALARHALEGDLRVPVQRSYQLEETPQAIQDFAQGTVGKYSVRIDGEN